MWEGIHATFFFNLRSTPDQNGTAPAKTQDFTGLPMPANLNCQCTDTGFNTCVLYRGVVGQDTNMYRNRKNNEGNQYRTYHTDMISHRKWKEMK